eukprot:78220_1
MAAKSSALKPSLLAKLPSMKSYDFNAAALSILAPGVGSMRSFGSIRFIHNLSDEDVNVLLDQHLLELNLNDDETQMNDENPAKMKITTLRLIHTTEQRYPEFKHTMDGACEWLYTQFVPADETILAQTALQNIRKQFTNPKTDIPHYFIEKQASGFFANFDEYFDALLVANVYEMIYEIVYKMIHMVSVSEGYPMIYFPLTWSRHLNADLLRCFGLQVESDGSDHDDESKSTDDDLDAMVTAENKRNRFLSQFKMDYYGTKTLDQLQLSQRENARCSGCRKPIRGQASYPVWRRVPFMNQDHDGHEFIFHDANCVLLRKYKEAIRQFIFEYEWKQNRPQKPIPDLHDDKRLFYLYRDRNCILAVDSGSKTKDELPQPSYTSHDAYLIYASRRRLAAWHLRNDLYSEVCAEPEQEDDLGKHELLRYMDVKVYGIALWKYCVNQLEVKNRTGLWKVMNYLASHLPTLSILKELENAKDSFKRFRVESLNVLCQTVIQHARFPAATALYLAGFMAARAKEDESRAERFDAVRHLFVEIVKELLNKIESDHLLAIRLELPTDINYLNILDIGLKFQLDDFLLFHRLQPIFSTMWRDFEYLNPARPFYKQDASFIDSWRLLIRHPTKFYYTPAGLFIIDFAFYIMYLFVFTYFIWMGTYPYDDLTFREALLWIFSGGFILYEIQEMWYRKGEYFAQLCNYWDIVISVTWICLFSMRVSAARFPEKWIVYYDDSDIVNPVATRATKFFVVYTALMAMQCVLLWTRLLSKLQRSSFLAPLIQMILDMISDVLKFEAKAVHDQFGIYDDSVFNDDGPEEYVPPLDSPASLFLYTVQTLLGQQDWELIASDHPGAGPVFFDESRAKAVDMFVMIFSVLGTILCINLLIALMTSTYERVREKSYVRVNFYRCLNTREMVQRTAIMPPPLNILVLGMAVTWIIFEGLIELCTCCKWTFSVERLSCLTYSLRDKRRQWIDHEMEALALTADGEYSYISNDDDDSIASNLEYMDVRYINYEDGKVNNMYFESTEDEDNEEKCSTGYVDAEKWCIFERLPNTTFCGRSSNNWSKNSRRYCRFCRTDMRDVISGDIAKYFDLFRYHGHIVDDADIQLMRELCGDRNYVHLCPHCFRPYIVWQNDSNRASRFQIMLEIISFYVFLILVWIPLSILMILPASWTWIARKCGEISKPRAFTGDDVLADIELKNKYQKQANQEIVANVIQRHNTAKQAEE